MKIVISPYSQRLRNNKHNPKNYPYWQPLIKMLKGKNIEIIQIGVADEVKLDDIDDFKVCLPFTELRELILSTDLWLSVDNFLPHFCNTFNSYGIVLFGYSDPNIFGYSKNINILKDRKFLRTHQFQTWEEIEYDENVFVSAGEVFSKVLQCLCIA